MQEVDAAPHELIDYDMLHENMITMYAISTRVAKRVM
jgi:hypothetical protein